VKRKCPSDSVVLRISSIILVGKYFWGKTSKSFVNKRQARDPNERAEKTQYEKLILMNEKFSERTTPRHAYAICHLAVIRYALRSHSREKPQNKNTFPGDRSIRDGARLTEPQQILYWILN